MVAKHIVKHTVRTAWVLLDSWHVAHFISVSTLGVVPNLSWHLSVLDSESTLRRHMRNRVSVVDDSYGIGKNTVDVVGKLLISESGRSIGVQLEVLGSSLENIDCQQFSNHSSQGMSCYHNARFLGGVFSAQFRIGIQESALDIGVGVEETSVHLASSAARIGLLEEIQIVVPVLQISTASDGHHNIVVFGVISSISLTFMCRFVHSSDVNHSRELIARSTTGP